jgi:hypothetical protein
MYYEKWSVEKIDTHLWDHASFHVSQMMNDYIKTQKDWLTIIYLPKKAPYLNPNERKVNQRIKSNICANRFYDHIEEQKTAISEYLDKTFGRWYDDIRYDTSLSYVNVCGPMLYLCRSVISKFIPINRTHIPILLQQLNTKKEHSNQEAHNN